MPKYETVAKIEIFRGERSNKSGLGMEVPQWGPGATAL